MVFVCLSREKGYFMCLVCATTNTEKRKKENCMFVSINGYLVQQHMCKYGFVFVGSALCKLKTNSTNELKEK